MYYWRITKYNPKNRDENGYYKKDEWTAISDIGTKYDDVELTYDSYLLSESAYVDAVLKIMKGNGLQALKMKALQKGYYINCNGFIEPDSQNYYKSLKTNKMIPVHEIPQIVRFSLREIIWCKLSNERMFVHFAYDYYMYVGSEYKSQEMLDDIERSGLFVEECLSPDFCDEIFEALTLCFNDWLGIQKTAEEAWEDDNYYQVLYEIHEEIYDVKNAEEFADHISLVWANHYKECTKTKEQWMDLAEEVLGLLKLG